LLGDVRSGNINTWSTKKDDESEPTPIEARPAVLALHDEASER
jgi:hypothetical protein